MSQEVNEPISAFCPGEPATLGRNLELSRRVVIGFQNHREVTGDNWVRYDQQEMRDKWGDLVEAVTDVRNHNPHKMRRCGARSGLGGDRVASPGCHYF